MARKMTGDTSLAEGFEEVAGQLSGAGAGWLEGLRRAGIEAFRSNGLPTRRVEAWRYTNLNTLAKAGFSPAGMEAAGATADVPDGALEVEGACRIVFVNGFLRPDLSDLERLPAGVSAEGLADILTRNPVALESRLTPVSDDRDGALAALNAAWMQDGLVLRIEDGAEVSAPIHLVSVGAPSGESAAFHPRNLVSAGAGSRAVLVESHIGAVEGAYFSNSVTDITVEQGAVLTHATFQNEGVEAFHVSLARVSIAEGATYDSFVLQRGGALARNEIQASIDGSGAECRLNGAYLGSGRQHIDNTTAIEHRQPGSVSKEVYKGVLDGQSRGVFQGRIVVHRDAQQTNGHQLNKTLLLSREAEIDAKPELEIYADDVKCSHGATAGELNEDELFYLRARGIDEASARDMLVSAFVGEALQELRDPRLAEAFSRWIDGWVEARHAAAEGGRA